MSCASFQERCSAVVNDLTVLLDDLCCARDIYYKAQVASFADPAVTPFLLSRIDKALKNGQSVNYDFIPKQHLDSTCTSGSEFYQMQAEFRDAFVSFQRLFRKENHLLSIHDPADSKMIEDFRQQISSINFEYRKLQSDFSKIKSEYSKIQAERSSLHSELEVSKITVSDLKQERDSLVSKNVTQKFVIFFIVVSALVLLLITAQSKRDYEAKYNNIRSERDSLVSLNEADPDEIVDYLNHYWGIDHHYYSSDEVRDIFAYAFCTGYQDALKGVSDPLVREYSDIADYEYYDSKYGDMFP